MSQETMTSRSGNGGFSLRRGGWKILLALTTSLILLTLSLKNVQEKSQFERLHDGIFWESVEGRIVAKHVDPTGPGALAGVERGDILVLVNHEPIRDPVDVEIWLQSAQPDSRHSYQILRESDKRAITIDVLPLPQGNVGVFYFLAVVGVFSLFVGTLVYVRRRGVEATAHFYVLCLFWFLVYGFSHTGKLDGWDLGFYWIDRVGVLFFPPIFLHFSLCFPTRKQFVHRHPWLVAVLYVPALILLYVSMFAKILFFSDLSWSEWLLIRSSAFLNRLTPAYMAFMCFAAFAAFVSTYLNARSPTVKKQTKWIVWGTGIGTFPFAVFYAIPYLLGVEPRFEMDLSVVPLALIPVSFAYAIIKYRLMDVEILFKRGVTFTLAATTVGGLFLAIFMVGTQFLVKDGHSTAIALLSAMSAVLAFTPIKSKIQNTVDRLFYRDRYDYRRALMAFSRDLNADLNLDHLSARLAGRIRDTFEVEKVALLLADATGAELAVEAGHGLSEAEWEGLVIGRESSFYDRLGQGEVVYFDEHHQIGSGSTPFENAGRSEGFQYAIPCCSHGKVVAAMLLGRRWDQRALSSEDMELLTMLSGQAATALENARLYRSLERKASQFEVLKEQSENTIESLEAGIAVLDLNGQVLRWNRALESLYGLERHEAIGKRFEDLFSTSLLRALIASRGEKWWAEGETTNISRLNLVNRRSEEKTVKLQIAPFIADGEARGTIVFFEDITERVRLESDLQLREKMVSLGLMAAGVAHEVNTPLTGISSFTQMMRDQTEGGDPRLGLLHKIEKQTERASRIVNNLLNFARHERVSFAPLNLNDVVTDVVSLQDHQLKNSRVKLRLELDESLPEVLGDENKLQQVFFNLMANAEASMPSGGWLTLATRYDGHLIKVTISDTGCGISQQDIKRIYDPFFTTKSRGSGTGLGLSITYGIIQEHSGQIAVDSSVGKGTTFSIELPRYARENAGDVAVARIDNRA